MHYKPSMISRLWNKLLILFKKIDLDNVILNDFDMNIGICYFPEVVKASGELFAVTGKYKDFDNIVFVDDGYIGLDDKIKKFVLMRELYYIINKCRRTYENNIKAYKYAVNYCGDNIVDGAIDFFSTRVCDIDTNSIILEVWENYIINGRI